MCLLCGQESLLLLGATTGLEEARVNDDFSKATFVDDPTAHLLSARKKRLNMKVTNSGFNLVPIALYVINDLIIHREPKHSTPARDHRPANTQTNVSRAKQFFSLDQNMYTMFLKYHIHSKKKKKIVIPSKCPSDLAMVFIQGLDTIYNFST